MINYLDKKWIWITPLHTTWTPPDINEGYTIDVERSFTRLVRASAYHINYADQIAMDADIYVIVQFDISNLEKEIAFAKKVKEHNKKLIVCYSADLRFLIGTQFISPQGILYTELCKYADVILSGTGINVDIFGRYNNKVLSWGLPVERLSFIDRPFKDKEIDILISGMQGGECLSFELEFLSMVKEKFPEVRITHSSQEWHREFISQKIQPLYPFINFVHQPLLDNLKNSKVYINLENRPRGGRALLDAWMCRVPFISSELTFYSQIFPKYTYSSQFNLNKIFNIYETLVNDLQNDYENVMQEANKNVEPLYFDNAIKELMDRLYPNI